MSTFFHCNSLYDHGTLLRNKNIFTVQINFILAFLPIGAYVPRDSQGITKTTPKEAVRIGTDIGACTLIGTHWGTIALSDEPIDEPPMKFNSAGINTGLAKQNIWQFKIGET